MEDPIDNPVLGTRHTGKPGMEIGLTVTGVQMTPFPLGSMVINRSRLLTLVAKELERHVLKPHINTRVVVRYDNFCNFPRCGRSYDTLVKRL
jgi:hypothetical protein